MTKLRQKLITARERWHRWHLGRWVAGLLGLLLLLAVLSWAILPGMVKRIASEQAMQQIGRKLELDEVRFSPFRLALNIDGLTLYEADQRTAAAKVKQLELKLSLLSLFRQALIINEVKLSEPYLHIVRHSSDGHGNYNFNDIFDKVAAMPKSESPTRFSLANLQIEGGKIEFDDKVVHEQFKIEALQIGLPFLSNFPAQVDSFVEPMLSATVNGSHVDLKGRAKPFANSLDTSLAIDFDHLDVTQYLPYLPVALPVQVKNAKLTTRLDLVFDRKNRHPELILAGDAHLDDVVINDKSDAPLLKFASLHTQIKRANILAAMNSASHIDKLELSEPEIWLDLDQQGQLNWVKLFAHANGKGAADKNPPAAHDASGAPGEKAAQVQLAALQISKGQVHFRDALHAVPAQSVNLKDFHLAAHDLSSAANAKPAAFQMAFKGEHDESLEFAGEVQPLEREFKGRLALNNGSVANYQAFLNPYVMASLAGQVDMTTQVQLQKTGFQLDDLKLKLSQFSVKGKSANEGSLGIKTFIVDKLNLNTANRQINIGNMLFDGVNTDIRRDAQAIFNVNKWLAVKGGANTGSKGGGSDGGGSPWKVNLANLDFKSGSLAFKDQSVTPEVNLAMDGFTLHAEKISSDLSQPIKMNLQTTMGNKASLSLDASASSQLKNISVNLNGQALPVAALFPYMSPFVNASLPRGQADIKGKLNLSNVFDSGRKINYDGTLALNDFQLLENGEDEDFLEWKNIGMDGISIELGSGRQLVTMKKLALNDFYARAILSSKGKLNIQTILSNKKAGSDDGSQAQAVTGNPATSAAQSAASSAASPAQAPPANPLVVRIAQTTLRGGNINFTDNFIKPNYTANLTGVAGNIGAIASDNPQPATIELNGKVDDDAPLLISGTVNPLSHPVFLDVKASANGLELTRLTPYAAKYAGYAIEKGKLSMQVAYHIENQQLKAENEMRLDQLTFGERVDSPTATKLPVMLAVALLRDNQGRIAINLPISGSLSDPQFSVGGIISKVFVNLITKAVTSPFSMLGAMFGGGGEELAYAEFLPGQTSLTQAAAAKLDSLATALKNRPSLKLDIIGRVDEASDTEGIRQLLLLQNLRELKWQDVHQKDRTIKKDDILITDSERAKYIEQVYQAGKFTKPRNAIGLTKTLPTAEAEKLILLNTEVTQDALRLLAQKRADTVRDYLEEVAGIERERLFLIAPKLSADGIKDKASPNRVDFSLK